MLRQFSLRKITSVFLCIVFLSSGCSGVRQEPNPNDSSEQSIENRTGADNQDNTIQADFSLFEVSDSSYESIDNFLKSRKDVQQINWSSDRRIVAFSVGKLGWEDQMLLWEVENNQPVVIKGVRDRICGFVWSPDNRYILADAGSSIQRGGILVDAYSRSKMNNNSYVGEAVWSPDSKWIAMGQISEIKPGVANELSGTVDMCIYSINSQEITILARATAEYYYLPTKWEHNGVLSYVKTDFKNPDKQETLTYTRNTEAEFIFYPSGPEFIRSIVQERGKVEITREMRERFNLFARDYRFVYLPDMNYYESFFDADQYTQSFGYNKFGYAVFYMLSYLRYPERMEKEDMQKAIQSMFVAKESYADMQHQAFRKLAVYQDGYYSPWPESGLSHNRMVYLLTGLEIESKGSKELTINIRWQRYYFEHPSYAPGENEKWLAEKAEEMGISDLEAAAELIANGEISSLPSICENQTTLYVQFNEENPERSNPRIVLNNTVWK